LSARDQVARLQSGKTKLADFDFQALRFDFGPVGRRALDRLARQGASDEVRRIAKVTRAQQARTFGDRRPSEASLAAQARTVRVLPTPAQLPLALRDAIFTGVGGQVMCDGKRPCFLFWRPADTTAMVVGSTCYADRDCRVVSSKLKQRNGAWVSDYGFDPGASLSDVQRRAVQKKELEALGRGEVRTVTRRQVFVGGKPHEGVFE